MKRFKIILVAILIISRFTVYAREYKVVQFTNRTEYKHNGLSTWQTVDSLGLILNDKDSIRVFPKSTLILQEGETTYFLKECCSSVGSLTKRGFTAFLSRIKYYLKGGENVYLPYATYKALDEIIFTAGKYEASPSSTTVFLKQGDHFTYQVSNKEDHPLFFAFFWVNSQEETNIVSTMDLEIAEQHSVIVPAQYAILFEETIPEDMEKGLYSFYAVYNSKAFSPKTCLTKIVTKEKEYFTLDFNIVDRFKIIKVSVTD